MKRIAFYTLGCKVNQVETEQMIEDFLRRGYQVADFGDPVDVCIINTCTVTHTSDRKSRAMLRRAIRANPTALVVATGCMVQVNPEGLDDLTGVGLAVDNRGKEHMAEIVETCLAGSATGESMRVQMVSPGPGLRPSLYTGLHKRSRAFVKIQDGCQSFCSYCVVPYARGPVRSKKPEDVAAEIIRLGELGYEEIVLTGIHSGQYGRDLMGWDIVRLLEYVLVRLAGDCRIRLSSLEPLEVNDRLLGLMAADTRICRHLHIPLQSGSDRVLACMGRRYNRDYYRELIMKAAAMIPAVAFTSDVMVGFPGEDETDFQATFDLISDVPLSDLHVFKYSQRAGTPAAEMTGQIAETVKQRRSRQLLALAACNRQRFIAGQVGETLSVLIEKMLPGGLYSGLSDNYIEVRLPGHSQLPGRLVTVVIDAVHHDHAAGHMTGPGITGM